MAMTVGTITILDDGTIDPGSSGAALNIYNAILAGESAQPEWPDPLTPDPEFEGTPAEWADTINASLLTQKRYFARLAGYMASTLLEIANADITIGVGTSGLQRTTTTGNPTNAPAAPVIISGAIS